jgi:predicted acyltransferase
MSRSLPLDALRGLAILLMVFSGRIPFGVLPEWMYHAQVPPPAHVFNGAIPGITWVDLVFPFFLFAMGAAIPLALQTRLTQGHSP